VDDGDVFFDVGLGDKSFKIPWIAFPVISSSPGRNGGML
jgi:hypothetical protein